MDESHWLAQFQAKHRHFFMVIYPELDTDLVGVYCGGGLDLGLTDQGKDEIRKFSKRFKKNPLKVKRIIASPELRAVQMADFLHDEMKSKLHLMRDLSDQFLGELEGQKLQDGDSAFTLINAPKSGEASRLVVERVMGALDQVFSEDLLPLLVVHPRVARVIVDLLGLKKEPLSRLEWYAIDLPVGQGSAHLRIV